MNDPVVGSWSPGRGKRVWFLFAALTMVLTLLALAPRMAEAGVVDLPTPPDPGCLDSVAGAVALDSGVPVPAGGIDLNVPGPVVQVIVEWMGRDDADTGNSTLDITVTGPDGVEANPALPGILSSQDLESENGIEDIFGWWNDITPMFGSGQAGNYNIDIEPFATPGVGQAWGATVTVVYDTSPCQEVNEVIWKIGADYVFGGGVGTPPTTDLIVFDWVTPLPEDTTVTIRASHGGADDQATECRVTNIWVAVGTGAAPADSDDLVDVNGNPVHPDAVEDAVVDPFFPGNQPCPGVTFVDPVTGLGGGNVGPQYALVEMELFLPAGSEWFAFQLESPRDNNGFPGEPESGAWGGGSLLIIPVGTQQEPDIMLEKTVLEGPGAPCPGVEGTDELVVGSPDDPVTYCFRVINTGNTHLFPVTLDDPDLGITQDDMTLVSGDDTVPLPPGGELVYSYEDTISGDLINTATVIGTPTDEEGVPIPEMDDVTDENDAEVQEIVDTTTTTTPPTTTTTPPTTTTLPPTTTTLPPTTTTLPPTTTTVPEIEAALTSFCDNDTPWLGYDIDANGLGDTAVIRFENDGGSAEFTVDVGNGQLLWPGAEIDAAGNPIDWPGWDQDEDGNWFLNPDNPFSWAREDVQVTVEVNPTTDPVTLSYPPAEPLCSANPPTPEIEAVLTPFCDNDTPWLGYDIDANGLGDTAVITFANEGGTAEFTVDVGNGQVLWPGAEIDAAGNPIDWPGWDQDEDGNWFLNPDNPFSWAREDVQVTVEVNPTTDPVTVSYPPAEPLCNAAPPDEELPATGATPGGQALFGALLLLAGVAVVAGEARTRRR